MKRNCFEINKFYLILFLICFCSNIQPMDQRKLTHKLLDAAHSGTLQEVKQLIAQGAPINCTEDGKTPLWLALSQHCYDNAEFLLQQPGIDVNIVPNNVQIFERKFPIHAATREFIFHYPEGTSTEKRNELLQEHQALQLRVLKLLIKKGADINVYDEKRGTPLHQALSQSNISLVTCLVEANARMQENSNQVTPLQLVCLNHPSSQHLPILLKSTHITYVDVLCSQAFCKEHYEKKKRPLIARKGRILKAYLFTLLGFNYWPMYGGWKGIGYNKMPIEIAKIIASYAALYAERTVANNNLNLLDVHEAEEFKVLDSYELLTTCEQEARKHYGLKQLYPVTTYDEFKASFNDYSQLVSINEGDNRTVGTLTISLEPLGFCTQPSAWNVGRFNPKPLYVRNFAIHPDFQRQKIGQATLTMLEEVATKNKCESIRVECPAQHPWLSLWFRKNGFKVRNIIELRKPVNQVVCLEKIIKS